MPHPRNRQSHGSNGDLPRVFTADTLIARQGLPSQDVRASPLASIPAITEAIRPEEAGCSRGPADRISGAQTPDGAERPSKDGMRSETILPFLILCPDPGLKAALPLLAPPQRELPGCAFSSRSDFRESPNSRFIRSGTNAAGKAACDGRHRRHRRSGWKGWRYRERPGIYDAARFVP